MASKHTNKLIYILVQLTDRASYHNEMIEMRSLLLPWSHPHERTLAFLYKESTNRDDHTLHVVGDWNCRSLNITFEHLLPHLRTWLDQKDSAIYIWKAGIGLWYAPWTKLLPKPASCAPSLKHKIIAHNEPMWSARKWNEILESIITRHDMKIDRTRFIIEDEM